MKCLTTHHSRNSDLLCARCYPLLLLAAKKEVNKFFLWESFRHKLSFKAKPCCCIAKEIHINVVTFVEKTEITQESSQRFYLLLKNGVHCKYELREKCIDSILTINGTVENQKKDLLKSYLPHIYCTIILLIGIWINLTKNPMKPIMANPIAVAIAIFWNSKNNNRLENKYLEFCHKPLIKLLFIILFIYTK